MQEQEHETEGCGKSVTIQMLLFWILWLLSNVAFLEEPYTDMGQHFCGFMQTSYMLWKCYNLWENNGVNLQVFELFW